MALFTFRPITLKQLNNFNRYVYKCSCLGGVKVTHPTAVQKVPSSIPVCKNIFLFFSVLFFVFKSLFSKTQQLSWNFSISFAIVIHLHRRNNCSHTMMNMSRASCANMPPKKQVYKKERLSQTLTLTKDCNL